MLDRRAAADIEFDLRLGLPAAIPMASVAPALGLPTPLPSPGRGEAAGEGDAATDSSSAASCILKASKRSMSGRPVLAVWASSLSAAAVAAAF